MHPIKNVVGSMEDLTPIFKAKVQAIKDAAEKALAFADCECPFIAEFQMSEINRHLREAAQIVDTIADYYQLAVPSTPEKREEIQRCWEHAEKWKPSEARKKNARKDKH